jgi:hypothetical protein
MQYSLSTLFLVFFVLAASLAMFGLWGIWFAGMLCIAALTLNRTKVLSPNGIRNCVCTVFFGIVCPGLLLMMAPLAIEPAHRASCIGLHSGMFGLALHNYHDANKHFPPVFVRDKDGKPLYSWMVEVLPMLEYGSLYNQLNKDEPWNSPHNSKVLPQILEEAICPSVDRDPNDCSSNYMAVIGPGTIWTAEGTKKIADFPNGTPYTVAMVEVVNSGKHWAEPFALTVDELLENMRIGKGIRISSCHPDSVTVLFADGATRTFPTKMPLSLWKRILDGDRVDVDEASKHIDPNAPDMVDVYVGHNRTLFEIITWALSFLVWLFSAVLLFYRAVKSRKEQCVTGMA